MRPRRRGPWRRGLAVALVVIAGCRDDPSFLGLGQLCGARARDVCDARAGCCGDGEEDEDACLKRETDACASSAQQLEAQALSYDAVQASRTRDGVRAQLDACGAVPELAGFFTGGLALGAPCVRGAQCASGHCDGQPLACVAAPPRALCADP